ncbi:hypothetical protein [Billgrantia saliphila]|uniref:hypothetical protein n=1 Tax=Billgrantia saliphila TaxID=1848458 RepID=UPI000CE315F0|nr:hypothetical protein [Halomonas saliphila]
MFEGLMWCFVVLVAQLVLLHYVDRRVDAMPRLQEPPLETPEAPIPSPPWTPTQQGERLDA